MDVGSRKDNNLESVDLENKTQSQKVDRVVLDSDTIIVIQKFTDQINKEMGDLVQISQKDIVNFLIQERSSALTELEIGKIKNEHFDIVRALKRATQEAIKAKQDGHEIKIDEVLKIIQTPGVIQNSGFKKPRGRKPKANGSGDTQERNECNKDDFKTTNTANISDDIIDSKIEANHIFPNKKST